MLYAYLNRNILTRIIALTTFYVLIIWLVFVFYIHGVKGLQGAESFFQITSVLRLSEQITRLLVTLVGILDLLVVLLLIFNPRWWILAWAAIWPWVPFVMIQYAGGHTHVSEFFLTSGAALVALTILPKQTLYDLLSRRLSKAKLH